MNTPRNKTDIIVEFEDDSSLDTNNKKITKRKRIFKCVTYFLGVAIIMGFCTPHLIPTSSMYPTINTPCICFFSSVATLDKTERFDVVAVGITNEQSLQSKVKASNSFCKRVIGLSGEKIEIKEGKVYINDSAEPLEEPYLPKDYVPNGNYGPFYIPEGYVFLMGDNRDDSFDSRMLNDTFFEESKITAQAWLCISKDGISLIK